MGIIVAGALVLADVGEYSHFVEGRILAPPVVLIVAGAIVFLVAFLGCFGAIRESHSLLIAVSIYSPFLIPNLKEQKYLFNTIIYYVVTEPILYIYR